MRALQQDAYRPGGETRQAHRVVRGADLRLLSADFAPLLLLEEQQRSEQIANPHERAGLRMQEFQRGYEEGANLEQGPCLVLLCRG